MSFVMPFTLNTVDLYIATLNGKFWARAREMYKTMKYTKKTAHVSKDHFSLENTGQKYRRSGMPAAITPADWPKDSQRYDCKVRKQRCKVMFHYICHQLTNRIQEVHQQDLEQTDAAPALPSDDLQDYDKHTQAIHYEYVQLQGR